MQTINRYYFNNNYKMKTKKELIQEKERVLKQTIELGMFITSDEFFDVSEAEAFIINKQLLILNDYLNLLIIRIELSKSTADAIKNNLCINCKSKLKDAVENHLSLCSKCMRNSPKINN